MDNRPFDFPKARQAEKEETMIGKIAVLGLALSLAALPVAAQESAITGLNNPRLLAYGADGTLYIAEAGLAGDQQAEGDMGPVQYGPTARVMSVAPGSTEAEVAVDGLISAVGFNNYLGVNAVLPTEDGWWLVLGNAPAVDGVRTTGLVQFNTDGEEVRFIDFAAIEEELNPDNDFVASNPIDIDVSENGTYYVIDASGNAIYTFTDDTEPEVLHVWEDLPVPTAVDVGPDGNIYVSFLSAFPFASGSARVEQWSPEGELVATYDGLTGVTDVTVADDGTLYAVEMATVFGDMGWTANDGRVIVLSEDGMATVAEGLNYPYGIAISPEGMLAVSVNSAFVEPGTGEVIWLDPAAVGDMEAVAPVETEEAS
jgi:hypothetical protein